MRKESHSPPKIINKRDLAATEPSSFVDTIRLESNRTQLLNTFSNRNSILELQNNKNNNKSYIKSKFDFSNTNNNSNTNEFINDDNNDDKNGNYCTSLTDVDYLNNKYNNYNNNYNTNPNNSEMKKIKTTILSNGPSTKKSCLTVTHHKKFSFMQNPIRKLSMMENPLKKYTQNPTSSTKDILNSKSNTNLNKNYNKNKQRSPKKVNMSNKNKK